jgi:hypothetical protein
MVCSSGEDEPSTGKPDGGHHSSSEQRCPRQCGDKGDTTTDPEDLERAWPVALGYRLGEGCSVGDRVIDENAE